MALFSDPKKTLAKKPDVVPAITTSTIYQGTSETKAATTLDGSAWTVTYFSQYVGADDQPRRLDTGLDPSLQSYTKVKNYQMKVTDVLTASNDALGVMTVTGGANMWPAIAPNQWDMFVGQVPDGRFALFTIKEQPTRVSFYSSSSYVVVYELVEYISNTHRLALDLEAKSIKEITFDPANPCSAGTDTGTDAGTSPEVVTPAVVTAKLEVLLSVFYEQFFHLKNKTFIYRDDANNEFYDGQVVEFMKSMISYAMLGRRPMPVVYPVPTGEYRHVFETVYDVLRYNDLARVSLVSGKAAPVGTAAFLSDFQMSGLAMLSNLSGVIQPSDYALMHGTVNPLEVKDYVFSEAFYEKNDLEMNPLEKEVMKQLSGGAVDMVRISEMVTDINKLTKEEMFYHIPVLIWVYLKQAV